VPVCPPSTLGRVTFTEPVAACEPSGVRVRLPEMRNPAIWVPAGTVKAMGPDSSLSNWPEGWDELCQQGRGTPSSPRST